MSLYCTFKLISNHPLTRDKKFLAYKRWLRWQIGSRMSLGACAVSFVGETRLLVKPGMTGATGNIYCGLHECHDMGFVLHFLREGDLFLDVGANIGSYTILASGVVGANTISFEPVPSTFNHLNDNIYLNRIGDRVTPLNVAVGAESGEIEMMGDQDTVNRVLSNEDYAGDKVNVTVIALDNVLSGKTPKLIKIDVEGFETLVLRGAKNILDNPELEAVLIELNGSGLVYGFDEDILHNDMLKLGFKKCSYNVLTRKLDIGDEDNWGTGNSLYVRNPVMTQELLMNAKKYTVIGMQL